MLQNGDIPVIQTHCRRVAAIAAELTSRLNLTIAEQRLIADAALVHHYPPEMLSADTVASALAILTGQGRGGTQARDKALRRVHAQEIVKILKSLHSRSLNQRGTPLPDILSAANSIVERLEADSLTDHREEVLQVLRKRTGEGLLSPLAFRASSGLPRPSRADLAKTLTGLPVFPAVALQVLAKAATADVSFRELAALASKDQVLAGYLLAAANSCLYSPTGKISTISHAISYVGIEEARRVITAASMRPLFASAGVAQLWKHSLETSRLGEELALRSRGIRKDEGFLAGLVHDLGHLITMRLSGSASQTFVSLMERGCDRAFAELCLFGCDHAQLGADALAAWKFPEHLVNAVLNHHRPERTENPLASLLYLVECRTSCEATPTAATVTYAIDKTRIDPGSLQCTQADIGLLQTMCFAA